MFYVLCGKCCVLSGVCWVLGVECVYRCVCACVRVCVCVCVLVVDITRAGPWGGGELQ